MKLVPQPGPDVTVTAWALVAPEMDALPVMDHA